MTDPKPLPAEVVTLLNAARKAAREHGMACADPAADFYVRTEKGAADDKAHRAFAHALTDAWNTRAALPAPGDDHIEGVRGMVPASMDEAVEIALLAFCTERMAQMGEQLHPEEWKKYKRESAESFSEDMYQMKAALTAISYTPTGYKKLAPLERV